MASTTVEQPWIGEIERLCVKLWNKSEATPNTQRIIVGISGIPGSGKSTLARHIAEKVNDIHETKRGHRLENFAVDIPMDGYHYSRACLASMENPVAAIHRRGAAFTFNAERFHDLIKKLREPISRNSPVIYAPSFDHAAKDPVEDSIPILSVSKVVIIEGNYISLDREPWRSAALMMDERWFVTINRDVARDRLARRHVSSGIVPDITAAYSRIDTTDSLNAEDILANRLEVDEEINSSTWGIGIS